LNPLKWKLIAWSLLVKMYPPRLKRIIRLQHGYRKIDILLVIRNECTKYGEDDEDAEG
jgi:hypothetical protein